MFSYTIDDSYRMSAAKSIIEEKTQIIMANGDIIVYATNGQVSSKYQIPAMLWQHCISS